MTLPSSGPISFSQINSELGRSPTTQFSLNDLQGRKLASAGYTGQNLSEGTLATLSNYRGHAKQTLVFGSTTTDINSVNYFNNYSAGKTWTTYTINNGVVIGSSSTSSYALRIEGNGGDINELYNNGIITGAGGQGGAAGAATSGSKGGDALLINATTTVYNNGSIWGGGGGGGGGVNGGDGSPKPAFVGGGGGGGGAGYVPGPPNGTLTSGGNGEYRGGTAGGGGNGGGPGQPGGGSNNGGGGGPAGFYIVGGGNVTWTVTGDCRGRAG